MSAEEMVSEYLCEKSSPTKKMTDKVDVDLVVDGFGFMSNPKKIVNKQAVVIQKEKDDGETTPETKVKSETKLISETGVTSETKITTEDIDDESKPLVKRFTWTTRNRMVVQVITYGATITAIKVPDRKGHSVDVVMGFENMDGYEQEVNPYFGATVGRVANRTGNATFSIHEMSDIYVLSNNKGKNHLHGGFKGFDKVNWDYHVDGTKVVLSYVSKDGEEGYPGTLIAQVSYNVTVDNTIQVKYRCTASKPTPVNLTNHSYFNLAGHHTGPSQMYQHIMTINGDKYTALNSELVTTGEKVPVGGTIYDLRVPRLLSTIMHDLPSDGFDLNYCITKGSDQQLTFVARALHPASGRILEVYSDQPGVQFYTGNFLPDDKKIIEGVQQTDIKPIHGKDGALYTRHGAFCLETQNYPNAVNHRHFPNSILYPGEEYTHDVVYKFGLQLGNYK